MRETPRMAAAFDRYCSLGPRRSLRRLREVLAEEWGVKGGQKGGTRVKLQTLERWSTAFHWQERVRAYDQQQTERRQQEEEERRRQEEETLRARSEELLNAVHQYLLDLLEQHRLGGQAAAVLWKTAAELKRDLAGLTQERVERVLKELGEGEYVLIKTHWGTPQLPVASAQSGGRERPDPTSGG